MCASGLAMSERVRTPICRCSCRTSETRSSCSTLATSYRLCFPTQLASNSGFSPEIDQFLSKGFLLEFILVNFDGEMDKT